MVLVLLPVIKPSRGRWRRGGGERRRADSTYTGVPVNISEETDLLKLCGLSHNKHTHWFVFSHNISILITTFFPSFLLESFNMGKNGRNTHVFDLKDFAEQMYTQCSL